MSAPAPTISSRLLDSDDIAQRFSTTRETVYKLVREDGLPAHRIRRRLLFDPQEVDQWMRSQDGSPGGMSTTDAKTAVLWSDSWVSQQVSKFGPDDLRRAAVRRRRQRARMTLRVASETSPQTRDRPPHAEIRGTGETTRVNEMKADQ
ncbi:hypothetical protein GCM10027169_37300 [Gordonia jinhuaensis]|uniref:Helix-turn-helix domain-containing protein n=1 Tax=Gordonia jinhuaensis TaxID=1517702 RepID=A0A916T148_9ACTN|nr:helix-turn-helix domain-containing protein [Gordonia jinhuaensis]GGB26332.1 hypothetical protein GCM10011489_13130 [Gordonia jinhuaensis]